MTTVLGDATVHATWTADGVAFWGWRDGRVLPVDSLRRHAGPVLGSWWARREATTGSVTVKLPNESETEAVALVADPAVAVGLLAARYPTSAWSPSLRWLHAATSLAIEAAVSGLVVPVFETTGLRWRSGWELLDRPEVEERIEQLEARMPAVLAAAGGGDARSITAVLADAVCRRALGAEGWRPPLPRSRTAATIGTRRALQSLAEAPQTVHAENERHEAVFAQLSSAMSEARGRAEGSVAVSVRGRLEPGSGSEEPWELRFEVASVTDPSLVVPWHEIWSQTPGAVVVVDGGSLAPVRRQLTDLAVRLAALVPGLDTLDEDPSRGTVDLDIDEVGLLLADGLELCERAGAPLLVPTGLVKSRLKLTASATPSEQGGVSGHLGRALVEVDWGLALGDVELTEQELKSLAEAKGELVQFREEWVRVDTAQARAALADLAGRRENESVVTPAELLRAAASAAVSEDEGEVALATNDGSSADGWLADLLAGLPDDELTEATEPEAFRGELRPYQRRALSWMQFLSRLGLGGCLADDMGLGKTPTTLAHLAGRDRSLPNLVLCPLSVVHNWEAETERFVPGFRVLVAHGPLRPTGPAFLAATQDVDLVVSTYGTASRDIDTWAEREWNVVVCDEAQAIKNHHTKAAHAVRRLPAAQKVALTGTPVENRLAELWAILDAVNPGMLGGITWFHERFATPIEQRNDDQALVGLRRMTGPFVLRRTKADRSLVPDLPDKIEQVCWASLTAEQAGLYRAVLDDFLAEAERKDGMKRRGLVLATLTRLKQICNHPAHFLGDKSAIEGRSGKLARLDELVEELLDADERALVFTQYRTMGELLAEHLTTKLGARPDFLHGGVSPGGRQRMIDRFQNGEGPTVQLVSLKAGGTGLNLTAASRVVHFDRWWNPAVEDQATDRAWRIGQQRTVFVHKLVCQGTLEERIDSLLEKKRALADQAVGAGEEWLTEMSTDELRDLLALDPTVVIGE